MRNSILLIILVLIPLTAHADARSSYLDALKIAQAKVERQKRSTSDHALSASPLGQFLGRPYQVGDSWKVAAWSTDSPIMRQTSDPETLKKKRGRGGIFLYQVTAVHTNTREVELRVTEQGSPPIDPRVKSLDLVVSLADGFRQTAKVYRMKDGKKDFVASADGLHAPISYLELLPLEAPELSTAVRGDIDALPALPPELQALAPGAPLQLDPDRSAHFEQDDFFGRSVEAVWRQGDPWPVYLKTANGTAILIGGVSQ